MQEATRDSNPKGFDLNEILFVLFMHKWKVLMGLSAGILAAVVFLFQESGKEFQAKLLVRYVLERSAIDPVDPEVKTVNASANGESVIASEVEILTSVDLAEQVAQVIGTERLLHRSGAKVMPGDAARRISSGLKVNVSKGSNVLVISFKDRDPELAKQVLEELMNHYFDKHLQVHRSLGTFAFVSQQTDQIRKQLHQTEEDLKQLKAKAGITSISDDSSTIAAVIKKTREALLTARIQLAEQRARVNEMENVASSTRLNTWGAGAPSTGNELLRQYEALSVDIARLRQEELASSAKYTPQSRAVQIRRDQIAELEKQRQALEKKIPAAAGAGFSKESFADRGLNRLTEIANLAAFEAREKTLEVQLREIQERAKSLSDIGTKIAQIERNKELEEANYKYFEASLEKARIDEALDPSKIPNISVVQRPSPVSISTSKSLKYALVLIGGGFGLGVALAFLSELVFDPKVKGPRELERRCGVPPLISIPFVGKGIQRALPEYGVADTVPLPPLPAMDGAVIQALQPFFAAVRDRLALYFELNGITRKPKLVGVAGISDQAGASTVAGGLANALAEMEEGRVLLVDLNFRDANDEPQCQGYPVLTLHEALRNNSSRFAPGKKLFLTVVTGSNGKIIPKRYFDLLPELKASEFDYIIFDMPQLNPTSATQVMAGFMDKFLLVVQADKDHPDAVKRSYGELVAGKASVSVVINKVRTHAPAWLPIEV